MVKNGEYFMIKEMKEKGMTITAISEHLNRDRKTVRKWLKKGVPEGYNREVYLLHTKNGQSCKRNSRKLQTGIPENCKK